MASTAATSRLRLLLQHRRGLAAIWVLTLVSSGLALLQPWPLQILVDHVLGGQPSPQWLDEIARALPGASQPRGMAAWLAAAGLGIFVLESAVDVALTMRWVRVGQGAVYDLGRRVFSRLIRRSPVFHAVTPIGDSLSRMTGDTWCIYNAASALVFTPLHACVIGVAMVVVLLKLNPTLALIPLAAAPLLGAMSLLL